DRERDSVQAPGPQPFWIHTRCVYCGSDLDECGGLPSVDQVVYWSHPRTRQFLQQHPRWSSVPARAVTHAEQPAILFQLIDLESADQLTVLAHPQTLQIFSLF